MTHAAASSPAQRLGAATAAWLDAAADSLDRGGDLAPALLTELAAAGLPRVGVPTVLGGEGGDVVDAVAAIADVSERSLAAGFVLWGHRTYIEYLLQSPNAALREALLGELLHGRLAGATGLSNAMKFLAGLEELQVEATPAAEGGLHFAGKLPWVTNLRPAGFHVAAAVARPGGRALVVSFAAADAGVARSPDLDLMALRGTNTAAIAIDGARLGPERIIHPDAQAWLPQVRPAFLGLQCGMAIGLARRALSEAEQAAGAGRGVLRTPIATLKATLDAEQARLFAGLRGPAFQQDARPLFALRIALSDIVAEAVALELKASGGKAYLTGPGRGFARRWREAAFIPVITPSVVQLTSALADAGRSAA